MAMSVSPARLRRPSDASISSAATFGPGTQLGIHHLTKVEGHKTDRSESVDEFELLNSPPPNNESRLSVLSKGSIRSTNSSSTLHSIGNSTLRGVRVSPPGARGAFGELNRSETGRTAVSRSSSSSSHSTAVAKPGKPPRVGVSFALAPEVVPGDVPFADGVRAPHVRSATHPRGQRNDSLHADQLALKLDWPLDVTGYNMERTDPKAATVKGGTKPSARKLSVSSSSKGSPSLCYYRKWTDVENASDSETEQDLAAVSLRSRAKGAFAEEAEGKVLYRAVCEAPCWTTDSKRYEEAIRVGVGRAGPYIWECRPAPPSNKKSKESVWTLVHLATGHSTKVRQEDMTSTTTSFVGPDGTVFLVKGSPCEPEIVIPTDGKEIDLGEFECEENLGVLHMDLRPRGSIFRRRGEDAADPGMIIAILETVNAMRDESAGAAKGRRDERGRLRFTSRTALRKVIDRFLAL